MKLDGPERPQPDSSWTDFNDRIEQALTRKYFERFEVSTSWRIAKCILFLCMVLFPAAYIGSCVYAQQSYRRDLFPPEQPAALPHPDAAKYEQPVLALVKPAMLERYGLQEFKVKYSGPVLCIKIKTDETRGPRVPQAFGLMEDIREMRRTTPELPTCAWMLEIDHEAMDGGMTIVLPDAERGYKAFPEWHNDALYTDASHSTGKAQP